MTHADKIDMFYFTPNRDNQRYPQNRGFKRRSYGQPGYRPRFDFTNKEPGDRGNGGKTHIGNVPFRKLTPGERKSYMEGNRCFRCSVIGCRSNKHKGNRTTKN